MAVDTVSIFGTVIVTLRMWAVFGCVDPWVCIYTGRKQVTKWRSSCQMSRQMLVHSGNYLLRQQQGMEANVGRLETPAGYVLEEFRLGSKVPLKSPAEKPALIC